MLSAFPPEQHEQKSALPRAAEPDRDIVAHGAERAEHPIVQAHAAALRDFPDQRQHSPDAAERQGPR